VQQGNSNIDLVSRLWRPGGADEAKKKKSPTKKRSRSGTGESTGRKERKNGETHGGWARHKRRKKTEQKIVLPKRTKGSQGESRGNGKEFKRTRRGPLAGPDQRQGHRLGGEGLGVEKSHPEKKKRNGIVGGDFEGPRTGIPIIRKVGGEGWKKKSGKT